MANFSATNRGDLTTAIAGTLFDSMFSLAKTRNQVKDNENLEQSTPGSLFLKALGTPFGGKTFDETIGKENPKTGGANVLGVQKPQISSSSSSTLSSSEIRKATSEFVANNPGIVVSDKDLKQHVTKAFGGAVLPKLIQAEGRVNNLENAVNALSGNLVNTQTLISQSNDILSSKFDQLIDIFGQQSDFQQKIKDKAEYDKKANELALKKDVSKVSSFINTATKTQGFDLSNLLTLTRSKKFRSFLGLARKAGKPIGNIIGRALKAIFQGGGLGQPEIARKINKKFVDSLSENLSKFNDYGKGAANKIASKLLKTRKGRDAFIQFATDGGLSDAYGKTAKNLQRNMLAEILGEVPEAPETKFPKSPRVIKKTSKKRAVTATTKKFRDKVSTKAGVKATNRAASKIAGEVGEQTAKKSLKFIPGVGTGISIIEAGYRASKGDQLGALMSLGSAIPFVGWGFVAADISRDLGFDPLNTLPEDEQYESGTNLTKPGTAILHGTEAVIGSKDREDVATSYVEAMDKIGSSIVSSAMSVANATGDGQLVSAEIKRAGLDYNVDVLPLSTDIGRVKNTTQASDVSGTSNKNPLQQMIEALFTDKKRGRTSPKGMFNLPENDIRTRNVPITIPEYDLDHNEPNSAVRMGENYYKTKADGTLGDKITLEEARRIILSKLPQRAPVRTTPIGGSGQYGPNRPAQGSDFEALDTNLRIGAPNDADGQHTGLNMTLPGGVGTPIYAPIDLIYRSTGLDGNPAVGLDGNPNIRPSMMGKGFGYYGAYYFEKDGKEYEVLLGHFKSMPYKGQKDGDKIPKGTLLGYQGASGNTDNGGADGLARFGGPAYPHISLHVNGIGFRATTDILDWFAKKIPGASAAPETPGGGGPKPTTRREQALLDTISFAEGTTSSYGTIFGGRVIPELANGELTVQEVYDMMMTGQVRGRNAGYASGSYATGRYQFMPDTIDDVVNKYKTLKWTDKFTPTAQDRAILSRIANFRGVTDDLLKREGLSNRVLDMLSGEFASFPQYDGTSMYNQPVKSQDKLRQIYQKNLETIPTTPEGIQKQIDRNQWLRDNDPVNYFGSNTPVNSSAKNLHVASSQTEESLEGPQFALQVVYITQTAVISKSTAASSPRSKKSDMTNLYRMASLA